MTQIVKSVDDWQPVKTAPTDRAVWVRSEFMHFPVKAVKGFTYSDGSDGGPTAFTSIRTVHGGGWLFPADKVVHASQWAEIS